MNGRRLLRVDLLKRVRRIASFGRRYTPAIVNLSACNERELDQFGMMSESENAEKES